MKILFIILLSIPSISFGSIIPLSCNQYYRFGEPGLMNDYQAFDEEFKYHKDIFLFDDKEMTIILKDKVFTLLDSDFYDYRFKDPEASERIIYTITLDRFTHQISTIFMVDNELKGRYEYDCKIVERKL